MVLKVKTIVGCQVQICSWWQVAGALGEYQSYRASLPRPSQPSKTAGDYFVVVAKLYIGGMDFPTVLLHI
jgi:hypothetical protein